MRKDNDQEMDSAMGPSDEPGGELNPPFSATQGIGGPGTEGKPGLPDGGTEPQIPDDVGFPDVPEEKLREAAEKIADVPGKPLEGERPDVPLPGNE